MRSTIVVATMASGLLASFSSALEVPSALPFVPVGLYFGSIEEGARIFGPVRLLPFEHPDALGHEFPNPLQLRGTEYDVLVLLGARCGLGLEATLRRYPRQPDATWPYAEFAQPPLLALQGAPVVRRPSATAPLAGVRAVAFYRHELVAFIVDTRGLSLAARGMTYATTMGLDMTRAEFLAGVQKVKKGLAFPETAIVVYERGQAE